MALPLPPRLAQSSDAGSFQSGASTAPSVNPSAGASPMPAEVDEDALIDQENLELLVKSARYFGMKYPTTIPAVQTITAAVQDIQNAVMQVRPPAEMAAPPQ